MGEKYNTGCFVSWQDKQLKDSNLVDPSNPWEIKGCNLLAEACLSRRCHWWMEELAIVAADASFWGRCKDVSSNNYPPCDPSQGSIPFVDPVPGQQREKKLTFRPFPHNFPTEIRLSVKFGI